MRPSRPCCSRCRCRSMRGLRTIGTRRIEATQGRQLCNDARVAAMDGLNPLLVFALTALIIEITPGPNMTYLAALSLSSGMRTGFAAVAGIAIGLATYGIVAALGLAAVIDSSPLLYGFLRWGGVAYLLWLAWETWSSERETSPDATDGPDHEPWIAFRRGLITNLLNPKAAVFYIAVLPEFIRSGADTVMSQTLALSAVYVTVATIIH